MVADIIKFQDAAATFERDKKVWQMLLAFMPPRKIADKLKISIDEVHQSQARMSGGVTPDFRSRQMQLIMEQVKELQHSFYDKAKDGDYDAAIIQLRSHDLMARLLGLYAPPMREEPLDDIKHRKSNTTEEISDLIDEIRGKHSRTIDGEMKDVTPESEGGDG